MDEKPIRFGLIGCGNSGKIIARDVKKMPELEVAAIYDTDVQKMIEFAQEFGIPNEKRYDTLNCMLRAEKNLDYVVVSVPSGLHAKLGIEVAKAGHNVVVEKPIEVTMGKADSLIEACKNAGVQLHVISQNRFKPDVQEAKRLIPELGDLIAAEIYMHWYRTQEYYDKVDWRGTWKLDGGGALTNQCIHMMDALRYLGGEPIYIQAIAGLLGHKRIQTEDLLYAFGKLKSGARFLVKATTCDRGIGDDGKESDTSQIRIYGKRGLLALDDYVLNSESAIEDENGKLQPVASEVGERTKVASDPLSQGGHGQQLYMIGRATRGENVEVVTGEDARATLMFNMAAYASIEGDGKRIRLPLRKTYVPNPDIMKRKLAR